MTRTVKRAVYTPVYLAFMALSTWATLDVGYFGVWAAGLRDPASMQILFDLVLACTLGARWLTRHARERGRNPWPWLVFVLPLGSIPLVTYAVYDVWMPEITPRPRAGAGLAQGAA